MAKRRFKKRYLLFIPLLLFAVLWISFQFGFMSFWKTEAEMQTILLEKGIEDVEFGNYEVEGRNIHFAHTGADSLPLIILVHGSPGSLEGTLSYLADPALRARAQIAAIDRPGFGESDFGNAEGSLAAQATALKPLLDKYGRHSAVLVGHSYGGPVICRAAMDFPAQVAGLVIVAGSIDPALEPHPWWQKPLDWVLCRWILPASFRVSNQEIIALEAELEAMGNRWNEIVCPVTVVQGMSDKLVHPDNAFFAEKMMTGSPSLKLDTLAGQDHFILWTLQDKVVERILEQVEALP